MNTPLLRTTARPPGPCRHDALDSIGLDLWRCRLCNAEITGLGLLEEKHARHLKSKTPGALTPGGETETENTKDKPITILPQPAPLGKGAL